MLPRAAVVMILLGVIAAGIYYFGDKNLSANKGKLKNLENNMKISAGAFAEGQPISKQFTCDGADKNPQLAINGIPGGTKSLALIMDDPDAPRGTFVHWVMWNIPAGTDLIGENSVPNGAIQGLNSSGKTGYIGPCPPSGTHRYFFKLYALDAALDIGKNSDKAALESAMKGHIISQSQTFGVYRRVK